jgi:MerR family transcriptional regulator, thiopeptide resistance regulator
MLMYTVKQLADLADVTVRTLHHYDDIDLLKPAQVGDNGYRYYDDDALLRLQQILFYREIGLSLLQIKDVLDSPDFDVVTALHTHRAALEDKLYHLHELMHTIDQTLAHLQGGTPMSKKQLFGGFNPEKQKDYEREARLQYGPEVVNDSIKRWNSYTKTQQEIIMEEGNTIYSDIVAAIEAGVGPERAQMQAILVRWHNHIRYFYEPTLETLRGLGDLYTSHPDFIANFQKLHTDLPTYLQAGIVQYVDDLETAEIERLLAEDEAQEAQD